MGLFIYQDVLSYTELQKRILLAVTACLGLFTAVYVAYGGWMQSKYKYIGSENCGSKRLCFDSTIKMLFPYAQSSSLLHAYFLTLYEQ